MKALATFNDWQVINDDVMGGVSTSRFETGPDTAIFSGELSLENNGGFASVRSGPLQEDLSRLDGFMIRVRGDGRRYRFTARNRLDAGAPVYHCSFATRPGEWQEHQFPFDQFEPRYRGRAAVDAPPLSPSEIVTVGFLIADRQAGRFRLEIAWIRAEKFHPAIKP
jgi:monofunctional biosynthetic peptidoglycan transglycosylase